MLRSSWNFVSIIFEVQTATAHWVWSRIMCRLRELTGSTWTLHNIQNFGNHTIETNVLYKYANSIYIQTISLLVMVPKFWFFFWKEKVFQSFSVLHVKSKKMKKRRSQDLSSDQKPQLRFIFYWTENHWKNYSWLD